MQRRSRRREGMKGGKKMKRNGMGRRKEKGDLQKREEINRRKGEIKTRGK